MSPGEKNILLSMEHIGKSFSGVRVLDDVAFDLRSAEVHVLAGKNGADNKGSGRATGGREAIETALEILNGKSVPKEIALKSHVFTKENIDRGGDWINEKGGVL